MKHYFTTLTLLFCTLFVYSQHSKLISQIELGGLRGIQLSKSFPILKSGGMAQLNVTKSIGDYVGLGLGVAYIQLEDETFTPLFINCRAIRNKNDNGLFYNTSVGYSQANNQTFEDAINSRYVGKMYFSAGMGYQYYINQKLGLTASFNYILQKIDLKHYNIDNQLYHTESLTIDLIAFKVGLILY
tara:strand:- start:6824 stop:7381 length:558 start_codon:yes stop_codon:yes gene_type:complete